MLAFGAFFIADMDRPNYSGTYCATAYWARNSGFRVEFWGQRDDLEEVPPGAVRACFKHSLMESGWSQLELESQPEYPDSIQAFAAGMLEGALTWNNIFLHWSNTIESECNRDDQSEEFCHWLRRIISTNVETVKKMADQISRRIQSSEFPRCLGRRYFWKLHLWNCHYQHGGRCQRNPSREGVPLARLEYLSRSRLFVRVVRFSRVGTFQRIQRVVPVYLGWKTGHYVL